jgi:hypothetical protein
MHTPARVMESVDMIGSKPIAREGVRVRVPPRASATVGRDRARALEPRSMSALFSFLPTVVALWLLAFALDPREPTAARVLWVVAAAIVFGPLAVALLGFLGWLVLVTAAAVALALYAATRRPLRG